MSEVLVVIGVGGVVAAIRSGALNPRP